MRIAIIGGGFCGSYSAYLLNKNLKSTSIELFTDPKLPAASKAASGLLHPFPGFHSRLSELGFEAYEATLEVLKELSLSHSGLYQKIKMERRPRNTKQREAFKLAAAKYPEWMSFKEDLLTISSVYSIDSAAYLKALQSSCPRLTIHEKKISSLSSLKDYDLIVLTAGSGYLEIEELKEYPFRLTKGQAIHYSGINSPLINKIAINHRFYLMQSPEGTSYVGGSTYEREFKSPHPEENELTEAMHETLAQEEPLLKRADRTLLSGIRCYYKDHLPLTKKLDERTYIAMGFGSRGLLYHCYFIRALLKDFIA